jgi:hypothetical protein
MSNRALKVGEAPPAGTECGVCADQCPDCGATYALGPADGDEHTAGCRFPHMRFSCPNPAEVVEPWKAPRHPNRPNELIDIPLPLCGPHARRELVRGVLPKE